MQNKSSNSLLAYQKALIHKHERTLRARFPEPVTINSINYWIMPRVATTINISNPKRYGYDLRIDNILFSSAVGPGREMHYTII